MSDIKLFFKMCKYGFELKMNILLVVLMDILGVVNMTLLDSRNEFVGSMFIMLAPMYFLQAAISINYTCLVAASSKRKRMNQNAIFKFSALSAYFSYAFSVIILPLLVLFTYPSMVRDKFSIGQFKFTLIIFAMSAFLLVIFFSFAYKSFLAAMVIYFAGMFSIVFNIYRIKIDTSYPLITYLLVALLIISVANLIAYLISKITYKWPYSKLAMGARLRSQL